uniref:Protein chromatin remodeling 24 n=1 Tax=Tanacetum cinerariifolium TaxID=118510 RepID=A0A699HZV1_TANCI|nr:protein chromatin remodeling 24 [Tanacetum cinerariifolium]
MAQIYAITMKMDAQYKEPQSHLKQSTIDNNDDDTLMSRKEETKFIQTFHGTCFYNDYRDRDSNRQERREDADGEKDDKNKAEIAARGSTLNMHNMISHNKNHDSCTHSFDMLLVKEITSVCLWMEKAICLLERNNAIEKFQEGEYPILLLTTSVSGVGLNLTQADRVILVDPSWNPRPAERCLCLSDHD